MSMLSAQIDELRKAAEYYDGSEVASIMRYAADTIWQLRDDLQRANAENAELREQMERLVTLLRVDCDIDASWDGLRRFWSIGLTENGCLMRDRACKAEAENVKLRDGYGSMSREHSQTIIELSDAHYRIDQLNADKAKLRELAREACEMARAFYNLGGTFNDLDDLLCEAAELGIEVDG